jgi:hypothetical protein
LVDCWSNVGAARCIVLSDGDGYAGAGVHRFRAPYEAFGRVHRYAADGVLAEVLCDLDDQVPLIAVDARVRDLYGVIYGREFPRGELDIEHRPDYLCDFADSILRHFRKTSLKRYHYPFCGLYAYASRPGGAARRE